jgi:putative FmdB family regulatory protein
MPLYDYECLACQTALERMAPMAERGNQRCERCGGPLTQVLRPQRRYTPFEPYYDEGLGVEITGRDHRRRVMRDLKCDHRDPPRPGDLSARRDRIADRLRERRRA